MPPLLDIPAPRADSAPINLIADGVADETTSALQRVRAQAAADALPYAGDLTPAEAWQLITSARARLIDVRTAEERKFVGYVPDSISVPWATGTGFIRNPRFLRELEGKARKDEVLLFFCRSGVRSVLAAEAATRGQFAHAFNVLEGFEGELDPHQHRGRTSGWRFRGLPWIQD